MPLSVANVIQRNSGSFVGTSGSATLPAPTVAGNTVFLIISQNVGMVTPSGFTADTNSTLTACKGGVFRKSNVGAESSWTIAPSSSSICVWVAMEVEGLDLVNPLDVKQGAAMSSGTGATLSTGLTAISSTFDGLIIAMHACLDTTSPTPGTWSGHTGGVVEVMEQGGNDGTNSIGLSVSEAYSLSIAGWTSTATKTAPVGQAGLAGVLVYTAAGARRAGEIAVCAGFGLGTAASLATGALGSAYFDALTGTPAIVATNPRTGDYCMELSSTAAAENVSWTQSGALVSSTNQQVARVSVYFPTSLPSGDVLLGSSEPATGAQSTRFWYRTASQKIGIQVGTGTEVLSNATVSANQWIDIDYRIDGRTTTHVADWQVTYSLGGTPVPQTQATMAAATVVTAGFVSRFGWTASTTATVRFADIAVSNIGGHYPLGDIRIPTLGVDPSTPFSVSGSSADWRTFTANGTLAAWDDTVAHNNCDERPPTLGASADGYCMVTATGGYVEMPMDTISAVALGAAIRAVRAVLPGWATDATAATCAIRYHDGVAETAITGTFDPQFDATSTPGWICKMVRGNVRVDWTQAKLDALALRFGFSGDATPDIGLHAAYIEVCLRIGDLVEIMTSGEGFYVHYRMDPDSGAVIQIQVTTPPGTRGATFSWTAFGTPNSLYVNPNTVHTENIGATDIAEMTEQSLVVDGA